MDPFKKKREQELENADTILQLARTQLNKKKKPVRFTWEGLGNLGISLTTNPGLAPLRQKRVE